jgi:cytoskeletal protein RodZ
MKWWKKQQHELVISNEQQRADKLAQLGSTLRRKREEKKLSLEEVEVKTLIRLQYLQAIEAGKLDELPEPVYIQGFIRLYAEALGLNGTEMASSFPLASDPQPSIKPVGIDLPAARLNTTHLYLLYILVIGGTVCALSQMLSNSEMPLSTSQRQTQPSISTAAKPNPIAPQQLEKVKPVSSQTNPASKVNKPVQIDVTLKAESWIRVIADGKKQFEGLLPQGTQRTWVAKEQLIVRVGNAGAVLVTYNQEESKPLGEPGQVQEVTFAANNTRL